MTATAPARIVLIGGGVATAAAAGGLRQSGFDGEIVLVTEETHLPYERPPLSKEFLLGAFGPSDFQVNPEQWYPDNGIRVLLGTRAEGIDTVGKRVTLADGTALAYDALVLGTGARARTLPGVTGERVHHLRSIADAERLGERLRPGSRLAVLGAGFIGCEVAAAAAARGVAVTVFERGELPLGRVLGAEFGRAVLGIHTERGVEIRTRAVVDAVSETASGIELRTADGEVHEFDELLVGIGSVPNVELAAAAGIEVDAGIITDEYGRTSAPDVYAVGDVAAQFHPGYGRRIRVEHQDTATRQGASVARNLLGANEPFVDEHYFWSHQYEHSLQSVGNVHGDVERVVRGEPARRSFAVFFLADGRIKGVIALDRQREVLQVRKLLAVPHEVTAEQLSDEGFQLKSLLPRKAGTRQLEVQT